MMRSGGGCRCRTLEDVVERRSRDDHGQRSLDPLSRRALQLAAGAGAAAVAAPYLARLERGARRFDLRDAELASRRSSTGPCRAIVTRAQWGANEALRTTSPVFNSIVKKIIVHHTGTPNDITDYPGLVRGIYTNELNNGYIDIAYNWLIDPDGPHLRRPLGAELPDGLPHTGERNRQNVQGAHALHFNADTIGIGLMGDYSDVAPTRAMIDVAGHAADVEVRALGHRPARQAARTSTRKARASPASPTSAGTATPTRPRARATRSRRCSRACARRSRRASRSARPATGSRRASAQVRRVRQPAERRRHDAAPADGADHRHRRASVGAAATGCSASDGGVFAFGDAEVPRLDRRPAAQPADRRHGRRPRAATATGSSPATAACSASATPKFFGSTGAMRLNSPVLGLTPTSTGQGLLALRARRRHLLLRRREVLRLHRRRCGSTARSSAWPRARRTTATG